MDGRQEVKSLPLIAAVVDTDIKPFLGKLGVAHISPCLSPVFQRFRVSPVSGGNSVKEELAVLVSDTVPVLVQTIDTVLFEAPCPVLVHGTDRAEKMEVGVRCAAFLGLFLVKCHIYRHAPAHKVVQQKFPCQSDIFLKGKLILQGNFKAVCKLGFLAMLGVFYGVPEGFPVGKFPRSMGRQENFGTDDAFLSGVVAVLAIVGAVELFAGTVSSGSHNRLPLAAFNLVCCEMEQSHVLCPPFCWQSCEACAVPPAEKRLFPAVHTFPAWAVP